MSESAANYRNKKRRRVFVLSVCLLAALAAGGIVFRGVEQVLESADRAH